ncbi:unnamed protein product [Linum tenue]|uniref:Small ribosomal subunit protein mS38 n=1 Tax=Linum tenue TaxID=586396 RepID=A0AAV0QTL7_9ROSI|nr:unnamed protein product [Linum tenue]
MANLIPKILRRTSPSSSTVAAALYKPSPHSPTCSPLTGAVFTQRLGPDLPPRPIPFFGIAAAKKPSPPSGFIYPSFPFGLGLNPIPAAGFDLVETEDEAVDHDDKTFRADSVKKKRKKKMNKHKYKKLRKRLRRKSRS